MKTNSTASCNVAIGAAALCTNSTGHSNIAIGYTALLCQTTANNNVAVGFASGRKTTTGAGNTTVGTNAGCNITTGSNNQFFGDIAGTDAVRNTATGSNDIVIGNNSNTSAFIKIDWTVTSDLRDKTEIKNVKHGLDFVNQITPIEYRFKTSREDETPSGLTKYGFKAQEILELEGDNPVIINNEDEENLKLTNAHLVPVLVNAIKELKAEIDELKKG